ECMAVNPDYQKVFQKDLLKANIGAIVNVMEDHMDVLGPTLDEVAESFVATIPKNGHLIVLKDHYEELFKEEAEKRNTEIIIADPTEISEEYLKHHRILRRLIIYFTSQTIRIIPLLKRSQQTNQHLLKQY